MAIGIGTTDIVSLDFNPDSRRHGGAGEVSIRTRVTRVERMDTDFSQ